MIRKLSKRGRPQNWPTPIRIVRDKANRSVFFAEQPDDAQPVRQPVQVPVPPTFKWEPIPARKAEAAATIGGWPAGAILLFFAIKTGFAGWWFGLFYFPAVDDTSLQSFVKMLVSSCGLGLITLFGAFMAAAAFGELLFAGIPHLIRTARRWRQVKHAVPDPLYVAWRDRPYATKYGAAHIAWADTDSETGQACVQLLRFSELPAVQARKTSRQIKRAVPAVFKEPRLYATVERQQLLDDDADAQTISDVTADMALEAMRLEEESHDAAVEAERQALLARHEQELHAHERDRLAELEAEARRALQRDRERTVEIARHAINHITKA